MSDFSEDDLTHLEKLLAQWPVGWDPVILDDGSWTGAFVILDDGSWTGAFEDGDLDEVDGSTDSDYPVDYACFVAKAVNALPKLLAEVRRRRTEHATLADGETSQRICDLENELAQARSDLARVDENYNINKALTDAAIARELAGNAVEAARTQYARVRSDLCWRVLKDRMSSYTELGQNLQRAIHRAITYRDAMAHRRITTMLKELPPLDIPAGLTERILSELDTSDTLRDGEVSGPGTRDPVRK